jgi:hypothetical protein
MKHLSHDGGDCLVVAEQIELFLTSLLTHFSQMFLAIRFFPTKK